MKRIDLIGKVFGRLTVEGSAHSRRRKSGVKLYWKCRCICGRAVTLDGGSLRYGHTQSCGCLRNERIRAANTKHGCSHTCAEYQIWSGIIARCENPKSISYHNYGGRGITICTRWRRDFSAFLSDMGTRPSAKHSIDRIDNDQDYEPGNCRWATRKEQSRNRRPAASICPHCGTRLRVIGRNLVKV